MKSLAFIYFIISMNNNTYKDLFDQLISSYVLNFLTIEENRNPDEEIQVINEINNITLTYKSFKYCNYKEKIEKCVKQYDNIDIKENVPFLIFCLDCRNYHEHARKSILESFKNISEHTHDNCQVKIYKINNWFEPDVYKILIKFDHKNYSNNNTFQIGNCKIEKQTDLVCYIAIRDVLDQLNVLSFFVLIVASISK